MADSGDVTISAGSVSVNGRMIAVAAMASAGTLLHTAVAGSTSWDQISIEFFNTHTATVDLTVEWGGTTAADKRTISLRPATSTVQHGRLQGGVLVRAFASVASVVNACVEVDNYVV